MDIKVVTILLTSIKWSAFALWVGGNGERNRVSSENGLWRLSLAKSSPPGDGAKFLLQHLQFVRAKIAEVATAYSRRQCEGIHEVPFARVDAEFLHEVETNAAKAAKFVQILLPHTRPFFQALTEGVIFRNRHFAKTVCPPVCETHDESSLLCFLIGVRQTIPGHPEAGVGSRRFLVVVAVHLLVIFGLIFCFDGVRRADDAQGTQIFCHGVAKICHGVAKICHAFQVRRAQVWRDQFGRLTCV